MSDNKPDVSPAVPGEPPPLPREPDAMQTVQELQAMFARFADIGIRLSTEHDLDKLLELILSEARSFTSCDAGSLYVVDKGELVFRVSQNDTLDSRQTKDRTRKFQSFRFPINTSSLAGSVALRGEILNIPDVQAHPMHNKEVDQRLQYSTRTMLVVPMRNRAGKVIGVLQLINALDQGGEVTPFDPAVHQAIESLASQAAVCVENAQLYQDIRNLFDALVRYSAKAIDARDPATAGHSGRVSALAVRLARAIGGFTDAELRELRYAGFFHDIGKIGVKEKVLTKENRLYPEDLETIRTRFLAFVLSRELELAQALLAGHLSHDERAVQRRAIRDEAAADLAYIEEKNRPSFMTDEQRDQMREIAAKSFTDAQGKTHHLINPRELECLLVRKGNLTPDERAEIQGHVVHTYNILRQIPFTDDLRRIPDFAAKHHEKLNGAGYPHGLTAEDLPLQARILAVVDVYEALTAQDRPYKPPMSNEKALGILRFEVEAGAMDESVVGALARLIDEGKIGAHVKTDDPEDEIIEQFKF